MSDLDDDATLQILKRILRDLPKLADAACVGRAELFDARDPDEDAEAAEYRHHRAAALCRTCPALDACSEYAATENPHGHVLAAQIPTPTGRSKKEKSA